MTAAARRRNFCNPWRILGWGAALGLILTPAVAMLFTDEVRWGPESFVLAIVVIGGIGLVFEMAVRAKSSMAYRAGVGVALLTGFLLTWINLAVGIVGSEDDPANMMFHAITASVIAGTWVVRYETSGMARTLFAAGMAQLLVGLVAVTGSGDLRLIPLNGFFAAMWLTSAFLLQKASAEAG